MKFFKIATPLLTWREPRLFSAQMRDRRGWMRRGALALSIAAVMMAGFHADRNWGGRGPKLSTPGAILLSAFVEFRPKNNRLREANALGVRDRIRAIMPFAN